MRKRNGFTLLEVLVVVIILGILATMALPNFGKAVEKAKVRDAQGALSMIYQSERMYKLDQNSYGTLSNLIGGQYLGDPAGPHWSYSASNSGTTSFTATATRTGGGAYDGNTVIVDQGFDGKSYKGTHPLRDNPI